MSKSYRLGGVYMQKLLRIRRRADRGLTLLEYCAGAAVLAAAVFVAFQALGGSLNTAMGNIGSWAVNRTTNIDGNAPGGGGN